MQRSASFLYKDHVGNLFIFVVTKQDQNYWLVIHVSIVQISLYWDFQKIVLALESWFKRK